MLAKRIIPCLDVTGGRVVKGVNFTELRDAGDPVEIARRYDASFVPLVCRFLGEDPQQPTRKLAIARALISGLTQLTLAGHFDLWMKQGGDLNTELRATIEAGVRMLLTMPIED